MAEKRNIILFIGFIFLTLTYWLSASFLIAEKPFEIKVLEEEQQGQRRQVVDIVHQLADEDCRRFSSSIFKKEFMMCLSI